MSRARVRAAPLRLPDSCLRLGAVGLERGGELLAQQREIGLGALQRAELGAELRRRAPAAPPRRRGACAPAPRSRPGAARPAPGAPHRRPASRDSAPARAPPRAIWMAASSSIGSTVPSWASSATSGRSACSARLTAACALPLSFSYSSPSASCAPSARRPRLASRACSSARPVNSLALQLQRLELLHLVAQQVELGVAIARLGFELERAVEQLEPDAVGDAHLARRAG